MSPALMVISRLLSRAPHMSAIQMGILLSCAGTKRTIQDLAKALSQSETTIGVHVSRLVLEDGLVSKAYSTADRRQLFIQLTPRGIDLLTWAQEP